MEGADRLVSWKRIARYLDRGERTVRRWAAEDGLPVHRVSDAPNASVFAFAGELDAWLAQRAADSKRPARVRAARNVLAFLPIENLSGNAALDTTIDGLMEETISLLGRNPQLGVIARTSVLTYRGTTESIRSIGEALGAEDLLDRLRKKGAGFHAGVVGHDHALAAGDPPHAGDHAGRGHLAPLGIHLVRRPDAELAEARRRVVRARVDARRRAQR